MNPQVAVSLILLILISGCNDSVARPDTDRKVENQDPKELSNLQPRIRERPVVNLTVAAIAKFKEVLAAEPRKHIRLSVKNEGSTGFMYNLQIDDTINELDIVDKSNGFTLVVDPTSSIYLEGATIGWQIQPDGQAGFKFDNPNALE